ncbi:MAG: P-II family nitrogen regulator [Chloroflexi bacterium]|nr:P-II family nitrogen regulator [Chloroflexota bacterium]MYE41175.1 P-II family nitrogen regulator [Chloroflexota bacterium]
MKMVRAIIRPEKEVAVAAALANDGFPAMTKWDVLGRGKQQGVQVGDHFYDELAKCMFMVVVEDDQVEAVTNSIQTAASTGFPGDGRVFVTSVESAFTLRTGESGL